MEIFRLLPCRVHHRYGFTVYGCARMRPSRGERQTQREKAKSIESCHTYIDVQPKRSIVYFKAICGEMEYCWFRWYRNGFWNLMTMMKMNEKPKMIATDYWKGKLGKYLLNGFMCHSIARVWSECSWKMPELSIDLAIQSRTHFSRIFKFEYAMTSWKCSLVFVCSFDCLILN